MKRMVKAGLALGMAFCLTVSGMALPVEVSAKKKAVKPKKITLNVKKKTLTKKGQTFKIKIKKVTPKKASKKVSAFKFKSSRKKVATVSKKGVIKAVGNGTCKVTVTSKKNKKAKKTITVKVQIKSTPKPPAVTTAPTTAPTGPTNPPAGKTNPPAGPTASAPAATATATAPAATATATAPAATATATAPAATATATAPPSTTTVPVQPGEKEIDGVVFKTYVLDTGFDYVITTEKADGTNEKTELPVKDLPNLLSKVTNIAGTYERWMELGSYTKNVNKVTYKIKTPDDSKMEEKTVTVTGSDNTRLNGKFDVKLTSESEGSSIYKAVISKQESSKAPLELTITDGSENVVMTGTYNEAPYRVVVAKDNSKVELFKNTDNRLAQITKQTEGYEMDLQKAEVESRKIVVEKLEEITPTEPPVEEGYKLPLTTDNIILKVNSWDPAGAYTMDPNDDGSVTITRNLAQDLGIKLPTDVWENQKFNRMTIKYKDAKYTGNVQYVAHYGTDVINYTEDHGRAVWASGVALNGTGEAVIDLAKNIPDDVLEAKNFSNIRIFGQFGEGETGQKITIESITFSYVEPVEPTPVPTATAPAATATATAPAATATATATATAPAATATATAPAATATATAPAATATATATAPAATATATAPAATATATATAAPTKIPDYIVPLSKTEYGVTLGQYRAVGYADIDPTKLSVGDKIVVNYTADCASNVKFQGEIKGITAGLTQTLGSWGSSMTDIGYSPTWNIPADTFEVNVNKIPTTENMRVYFATNSAENTIKSFEITSVKVLRNDVEVEDAVVQKSPKFEFAGVNEYAELARVSLADYYDSSKYESVSVKYTVSDDTKLGTQIKVMGSKDCKTPISSEIWDKQVAAIEYVGSASVQKTLSFSGLADDDTEPSVTIHTGQGFGAPGFVGKITIQEIKLIGKEP